MLCRFPLLFSSGSFNFSYQVCKRPVTDNAQGILSTVARENFLTNVKTLRSWSMGMLEVGNWQHGCDI